MHLTRYTDFSVRLLMALGLEPERPMTIRQVSEVYGISRNHLVKVVNRLAHLGIVETTRGRRGGVRLARPPEEVAIGSVVRAVETSFDLADCFADDGPPCVIVHGCGLRDTLQEALGAFLAVLDRTTLADLLHRRADLVAALRGGGGGALVQIGASARPASPSPADDADADAETDAVAGGEDREEEADEDPALPFLAAAARG